MLLVAEFTRLPIGIAQTNCEGRENGSDKGEYDEAFEWHDVFLHEKTTMLDRCNRALICINSKSRSSFEGRDRPNN